MHPARPQEISAPARPPHWQAELARGFSNAGDVLAALGLGTAQCAPAAAAAAVFPLRVPRGFVRRMRPGDPRDPLLLQILPTAAESASAPGFVSDPVGDVASARVPGLL